MAGYLSGRRSERTYAIRAGSEKWAFVPHPEVASWWFRCDLSVLVVRCPYTGCGAEKGQPCKNEDSYHAWTHHVRRTEAKRSVSKLDLAHGIVMNIENPRRRRPSAT